MDDAPPWRHAGARVCHAARRTSVQLRQAAGLDARPAAGARQREASSSYRGRRHGARVRQRASLHVFAPSAEGAMRGAGCRAEGGPSAQPARFREIPALPRLRVRSRVPALRHIAYLPRTGQRARVPPLRLPRACTASLPAMRQSLLEEVRRGHAARRGRVARAVGGTLRRRRRGGAGGERSVRCGTSAAAERLFAAARAAGCSFRRRRLCRRFEGRQDFRQSGAHGC